MKWNLDATSWTAAEGDWLVVGISEGLEQDRHWGSLDTALQGQLTRLRESLDLTGKLGELLPIHDVPGLAAQRLLLVGLGNREKLQRPAILKALTIAARHISTRDQQSVSVAAPGDSSGMVTPETVQICLEAFLIGSQGQDVMRGERQRFPISSLQVIVPEGEEIANLRQAATQGEILGEAVNLARELINLPPNVIYPASFAERAEKLAAEYQLGCRVLNLADLQREKMGSMLAVARGSGLEPRLVVLEYNVTESGPRLGICGKGVTFDSGGLSLKPNDGMLTMKCDMAGAATTLAAVLAMARLKLPVRVVGLMGLVENMPGGDAFRLGDVLTARSGVTIEVLNTDAEGRLVLADVLNYALEQGADYLIDLATLTGACVVALGEDVTGAFSNSQPWCDQLLAASRRAGEDVWQLPMFDLYADLIKSDVADIKNVGGRWGGAITAAKFLEKFVNEKPWVHLDIAGPAFASANKPYREGGGTGCMVRTLVETARHWPPSA